jgi:hypothetical protein
MEAAISQGSARSRLRMAGMLSLERLNWPAGELKGFSIISVLMQPLRLGQHDVMLVEGGLRRTYGQRALTRIPLGAPSKAATLVSLDAGYQSVSVKQRGTVTRV